MLFPQFQYYYYFLQFYLNMLSFFKTIIFEIYTLIKETGYKYASPRG